jgi:hypothetical protein
MASADCPISSAWIALVLSILNKGAPESSILKPLDIYSSAPHINARTPGPIGPARSRILQIWTLVHCVSYEGCRTVSNVMSTVELQ